MRRTSKKSIIAGIVALSLILMGTGYAYWTDTLNLNAKATTGDLDVTFADLALYAQYPNETRAKGWSIVDGIGADGYVEDLFFSRGSSDYNKIAKDGSIQDYYDQAEHYNSVDFNAELDTANPIKKDVGPYTTANTNGSDQINIVVNNMYPGYAQTFRTDILNIGDMAATLGAVNFNVTAAKDADVAKQMLGVALFIESEEHPQGQNAHVFELANQFTAADIFQVGGVDFVRLSALDGSKLAKAIQSGELLCNSEHRMDLFIGIAMDPDEAGVYTTGKASDMKNNDDSLSQLKEVVLSVDFIWEQFNVGKDAGDPNILEEQNK